MTTRRTVVRSGLLIGVGVILWFTGWYWSAGEARTEDQAGAINLAVLGVLLSGAGMWLRFVDGRRAVGLKRRALIGELKPVRVRAGAPVRQIEEAPHVLAGGGRYFHRPTCAIAAGRDLPTAVRADHEAANRRPCGVCAP